jgi:hypothetical protein
VLDRLRGSLCIIQIQTLEGNGRLITGDGTDITSVQRRHYFMAVRQELIDGFGPLCSRWSSPLGLFHLETNQSQGSIYNMDKLSVWRRDE